MTPFDDALGQALANMGLAQPVLMLELEREWAELAGEPWTSQASPLYVRSGVLVVQAHRPAGVGFLRYGVSELERKLAERFGAEAISSVEVRPPQRRPGRGR